MSSSKGSSRSRRKVSHEDEDTNNDSNSNSKHKRSEESKKKKSGPGVISSSSDPYEILNLSRNATSAQIKSAYRKLALKYHPDKQSSDDEKKRCSEIFTRIGNAYEVLSDENRKREFDLYGRMENDPSNVPSRGARQHHASSSGFVPSRGARQHHASSSGFHDGFHHQLNFGLDRFETFSFNRRPAGFRDPFELFRQVFQEHDDFFSDSFHHPTTTRHHQQRHHQQQQQRNDMFPSDPFMNDPFFSSPFGSMGGSMFGGGLFGGGGLASSMSRQMHTSSMHQSSFSSSSSGSGAMRESVSASTRMINGKRQTVTKRTIMRPDGSVETRTETSGDDDYAGGMLGKVFFDINHDRHLLSDQQQQQQSLRPSRKNSKKKRRM